MSPRDCTRIPLLLCVAEPQRPGRLDGLDDSLFTELETRLGALFATSSAIIARGRVGAAGGACLSRTNRR
jgi:3-oxoacyl-[acyl-carrier-protein] synthase-1